MSLKLKKPARRRIKLFVSHAMNSRSGDIRRAFCKIAKSAGFEPVLAIHSAPSPPLTVIRDNLTGCEAFVALMTAAESNERTCQPWVIAEIGMALYADLPMIAVCEKQLQELGIGLLGSKLCLEWFEPGQLLAREAKIKQLLKILYDQALSRLALSAPSGHTKARADHYSERFEKQAADKELIATYVFSRFVGSYAGYFHHEVFVDSGTTTFRLLNQLATSTKKRVRVRTNNIPGLNKLARIPEYPVYAVPGQGRADYRALLGEETTPYLHQLLTEPIAGRAQIKLAIIAATAINASTGICCNDNFHASLKRELLENCPHCVVIFDYTKLLQQNGPPIFESREQWDVFVRSLKKSKRRIQFVTRLPGKGEKLQSDELQQLRGQFGDLRKMFGRESLIVLPGAKS